jgi:hypothetical protein
MFARMRLMAKRPKHSQKSATAASSGKPQSQAAAPQATCHPPARHPTLLTASVVLFVLWFVFLLVAAVWH